MRIIKGVESWRVEYEGTGGQPRRKWFDNETDAREWAEANRLEVPEGKRRPARTMTFGEVLARYHGAVISGTRSAKADGYRIDRLRRSALSHLLLPAITPERLAEYCAEREREAVPGTIHNDIRLIRRAIAYAQRELNFRVASNAAMGIQLPKRRAKRKRGLHEGEAARLMRELASSPTARDIVEFALATGLGRAALFDLRWEHIDDVTRCLSVPFARVGSPSSIVLSDEAMAILRRQPHYPGRCFRLSLDRFRWTWREAVRKAGLEGLRFDDLKHQSAADTGNAT